MLTVPSRQKEKLDALMSQVVLGFNAAKLDWIQQVKNVTAVLVRAYVPNVVPPQTWWIWVDTAWGKSYISTWTTNVSDWGLLWTIGWSVATWKIAIGNSWWLTSYTDLSYTNATQLLSSPNINAVTEYKVWWTKVVWARQTAGYTPDSEAVAYTGIDNLQAWTPYAQLTDLNQLRIAYEALRAWYETLRTALQTHWLIS